MPNQRYNSFEIASDEIQQIIGQVPNWITRWGISVLLLTLVLVLFLGAYIKYPSIILANAEIDAKERPTKIEWFNEPNLTYTETVEDGQKISAGDTILIEKVEDSNHLNYIQSPTGGEVSLTRGTEIDPNVHVIWIIPKITSYEVTLKVSSKSSGKVKENQFVKLNISEFPSSEYGFVAGYIYDIVPMSMGGTYRVKVKLKNGLITNMGKTIPSLPNYIGDAEIITDNTSILSKFFPWI